jgi:acetoin utilization protein AcuB
MFSAKLSVMKPMPTIRKFMTAMPHTINGDMPLKNAIDVMRNFSIRHLPVQSGGNLIGILTDRDVKLASSFHGAAELTVEDVMSPDPYTVDVDAAVDEVAINMAEHKYGSVIVRHGNGEVVGIFTATDGLRVLAEILQMNYEPQN